MEFPHRSKSIQEDERVSAFPVVDVSPLAEGIPVDGGLPDATPR